MNPSKAPSSRLVTRTPLRSVPNQKRTRRNIAEEFIDKNGGFGIPTRCLLQNGVKDSKLLPSPSLVSNYSNESTEDEEEYCSSSEQPSTSRCPKEEGHEKNCGLWDWRATQIGSFMKKRRYIGLKKKLDAAGSSKQIVPADSEIFLKPQIVSTRTKKSKYNPHEECFVTDISHRSKRVVLFRKRRHAQISGQITDEMVRKVQVPVETLPEDRMEFSYDLTPYLNEERRDNIDIDLVMEPDPIESSETIAVNRLEEDVVQYFMDDNDKKFFLRLNKNLDGGSSNRRDENNKKVVEPLTVKLRKVDFAYLMGVLETVSFKEIHNILLEILNVPNQAEGDNAFCEVCQSETSEKSDPIVFCERCELSVHQNCFGILELPKDEWYCDVCREYGRKTDVSCRYCPLSYGTMKHTIDGDWAHFACAVWQKDLRFDDLTTYTPISHEWDMKPESFLKICSVCDLCYGSVIKCSVPNCKLAFHSTCGLRGGLLMFIEDNLNSKIGVKMFSFCYLHSEQARSVGKAPGNNGVDFLMGEFTTDEKIVASESYKMSKLSKIEAQFDQLVNWRQLSECTGVSKETMKEIFDYWAEKRKKSGNRIMVNQTELNEIYIKKKYKKEIIKKWEKEEPKEDNEQQNAELVKEFAESHWKLDRCRNLCTLALRREKLKLMQLAALREAIDWVLGSSSEELNHFSSRTMEKLLGFWSEFSGKTVKPPKSPSKNRPKNEKSNKAEDLFTDLLEQFPELDPQLLDALSEENV
ncbi:unnamed protein product [Bursaphelenchus xylophilus]|uniref:(pine wood nematode) hypothetical protein n=1 Tax=Bursaphelenchus xylophilus TaxID=6326 RepID=A0A1I7SQK1_BURXY|nr:unnamed protein product [Bursaphelenchus xylophilus]CAG9110016.1 unnamed protein product [Bursaphelenchus xylophilus]